MSLLSVPNEILTIIAEGITELKHLNALVRTSRKLYLTLNPHLYKLGIALPSDEDHESVLHWALNTSQISTVDLLLANGQDIDEKLLAHTGITANWRGSWFLSRPTALQAAVCNNNEPLVRLLLQRGAEITGKSNNYNDAALHVAANHGHSAMIRLLLSEGADINMKTKHFESAPLHYALYITNSKWDTIPAIRTLLENGANIEARNCYWYTPLMEAVYQQYAPAVEVLLEYGADVNAVDLHGFSTMDIAAISNTEVTKLIVEYNGVYGAR